MRNNFKTAVCWVDGDTDREAEVRVFYSGSKGYRGSQFEPPEDDSVEIEEIRWLSGDKPLPEGLEESDDLIAECFADWNEYLAEAAEWRAQSRRDQLMGGF